MLARLLVRNVGTADRVVRVALGAGLLALYFAGPQTPWGLLGVIPLATAALGTCPLYTMLGLRTCPLKAR